MPSGESILDEICTLLSRRCEQAMEFGPYGSDRCHIESVENLGKNTDGAYQFRVKIWDESDPTPKFFTMGLAELAQLLGRLLASCICDDVMQFVEGKRTS